ncbi:MAG: flagellar M-ring protein FliF C-terminal domain-containing protein, partial [Bryobacteraceae bacterium]
RANVEHEVQRKAAQTLEPLLGAGHFRVGVSADVDLASGEQSEETFDPAKSVMLTSQITQDGPGLPAASGVPGTASNIPRPTATPESSGASSTNYARHTESFSYQTSRVVKHTRLPQGGVKRLSLSVLVDHSLRWDHGKRIIEPPTAQKLKVIHDLVAAATGLDMNRGDQLVVEAFPFESTLTAEPLTLDQPVPAAPGSELPSSSWLANLLARKNGKIILGFGGGVALVLVVGAFALLRRASKKKAAQMAAIEAAQRKELASPALDPEKQIEARIAEQAADQARKEAEAMLALKVPVSSTKKTAVLTKHIAAEAKANPTAMAHVVRSWLHGEYKR